MKSRLKEFLGITKREAKEETPVPKKIPVKFNVTDGLKPTQNPPAMTFNLRCPVPMRIEPRTQVPLKLGLSCEHPLQLFESKNLRDRGLRVVDGAGLLDAKTDLVLRLENVGTNPQYIEAGETIVRAHVLDDSALEVG